MTSRLPIKSARLACRGPINITLPESSERLRVSLRRLYTLCVLRTPRLRSVFLVSVRYPNGFGESPIAYVRRTRLGKAAMLLKQTDLTLGEVARRSGYATEASLSRAFKRSFGVTPGAYRLRPASRSRRLLLSRSVRFQIAL